MLFMEQTTERLIFIDRLDNRMFNEFSKAKHLITRDRDYHYVCYTNTQLA